jgi:hypothetical protein
MSSTFTHTKPIVESYGALKITDLRKTSMFFERFFCLNHRYYFADLKMRLLKGQQDWYLSFENYGPKNSNNTISLLETPCHYGGYREWFECPSCKERAGVLYLHEDNFSCRKCLGLGYYSQRMNYNTLAPLMKRILKLRDTKYPEGRLFYKGKLIKRVERYERLQKQVRAGSELLAIANRKASQSG